MRILQVTPIFYPALGGIETVVAQLSSNLVRLGIASDVAHVAVGNVFACETGRAYRVWRVPMIGTTLFGLAPRLAQIAKDYDLLHVHDPQLMAITANVAIFGCGKPAVLSTHGGFRHSKRLRLAKYLHDLFLTKLALSRYRRVLATSSADFEHFRRRGARVDLAPNGVDTKRFAAAVSSAPRSLMNWVYWGRLSQNKRLDMAIRYAASLRRLGCPVNFAIYGHDFDGLSQTLARQIEVSGLQGAVTINPALDDEALLRALSERGLFITGSEYEGFGLSLIEAMSAGLAVACRDVAPLNRFVDDGADGTLLKFDASAADLEKLRAFVSRSPAESKLAGERSVRASMKHDWSIAIAPIVQAYEIALGRRSTTSQFEHKVHEGVGRDG